MYFRLPSLHYTRTNPHLTCWPPQWLQSFHLYHFHAASTCYNRFLTMSWLPYSHFSLNKTVYGAWKCVENGVLWYPCMQEKRCSVRYNWMSSILMAAAEATCTSSLVLMWMRCRLKSAIALIESLICFMRSNVVISRDWASIHAIHQSAWW